MSRLVAADMAGVLVLAAVLLVATALGVWLRHRGRRLTRHTQPPADQAARLSHEDLGQPLGERATLVHFSTVFCQPCRATRRTLDEVAALVPGVAAVEVDAESQLDLVRALDIRRTPTVLVLDRAGRVVRRASGQPRKADVIAAVGAVVSA